jgi:bacterial/archaeal transporter family-2 protein
MSAKDSKPSIDVSSNTLSSFYIMSSIVGAISTMQAAVNSKLGQAAGQPLYGALICYIIGSSCMFLISYAHAQQNSIGFFTFSSGTKPQWWEFGGGVAGAIYMAIAVTAAPIVGVEMFFSLVVVGQLSASIFLDHIGFVGLPISLANKGKFISLAVALAGVIVSALAEGHAASSPHSLNPMDSLEKHKAQPSSSFSGLIILYLVSMAVGALQPLQAALNWRLGNLLPHKLQAVATSFFIALLCATVGSIFLFYANEATLGDIQDNLLVRSSWWMYLGPVCQLCVLFGGVVFPAKITTSLYYLLYILGELIASLIFDHIGAFGLAVRLASSPRVIGLSLVMVGSIMMHFAPQITSYVDGPTTTETKKTEDKNSL